MVFKEVQKRRERMKVMKISADVRKYENFVIEQKKASCHTGAGGGKGDSRIYRRAAPAASAGHAGKAVPYRVKAVFLAKNPKKTIGLRADMDALPVQEPDACRFSIHTRGRMHACGHDGIWRLCWAWRR